jgi:hypothetical protein
MAAADQIRRFATLGNRLPRHCGIATFTTHLTEALVEQLPGADGFDLSDTPFRQRNRHGTV